MARSSRSLFGPARRTRDQDGIPEPPPEEGTVTLGRQSEEEQKQPAPATQPAPKS